QAHAEEFHNDGRSRDAVTHEMRVQVSRGVYPEVPQEDALRAAAALPGASISPVGAAEGESDRGGASDARARAHDDRDTAEVRGAALATPHSRFERLTF